MSSYLFLACDDSFILSIRTTNKNALRWSIEVNSVDDFGIKNEKTDYCKDLWYQLFYPSDKKRYLAVIH